MVMQVSGESAMGTGLDATLRPLREAQHLPGCVYDSSEILALEKEKVFMKDWLCLGRVEEVENPGDYITARVLDEPIVVARNPAGELNAFANVCAHRGVEVATGSGNTQEFSCPYHGWLYDLDGRLVGAPYMKEAEGFDPAACRLKPLKLDVWAGWIFVTFDPDTAPLADSIAHFAEAFGFLRQEDCRLADKVVTEWDCNWKFLVENLMDFYHVWALHEENFGRWIPKEDFNYELLDKGGFRIFYQAAPMTADGKSRFGVMPALDSESERFACGGYLAPNMNLLSRCDYVRPYVIWPLAANKTRAISYSLFPKEHFDLPDFDERVRAYHDFLDQVVYEDRDMVQSLQRGMGSRHYRGGRMSHFEEPIHNTIRYHVNRLFDDGN